MKDDRRLNQLVQLLASMPGLGPRSARRAALYMMVRKETHMLPLAEILQEVAGAVSTCGICGNLDMSSPCGICSDPDRDKSSICIVSQVSDLWAIERTGAYKGVYHVLGGVLSALDGVGPEDLNIASLSERLKDGGVREVILALSATVDGQSTAHYLTDIIDSETTKVTRLAHGVPVGGELDYLDDGTIATALRSRASV